ncbi:hypothetical protein CBY_1502 [Clostridium butyricum 5521]|uniref:Uncharacterized protein n=1 Tax=Clostridium butyricum E4 str. BoNT E BL5262 TaxID=632245 RepID=C4IBI4_CLOBU|nr:hypothetical protein CBY_1502 [Clostridium butyricum 5521]EEP56157.1 hypothetical protein CLP_0301 [Clostridium butyricum E4 str. BoNT E BL5262]
MLISFLKCLIILYKVVITSENIFLQLSIPYFLYTTMFSFLKFHITKQNIIKK